MKYFLLCFLLAAFFISQIHAQKTITVTSPDKQIYFSVEINNGHTIYAVTFKNKKLIDNSLLSLDFENGFFGDNVVAGKPVFRDTVENYELLVGKAKKVGSHYREVCIPLQQKNGSTRKINLVARVFDDGVAFRYEFPSQASWSTYALLNENTEFHFSDDPIVRTLFLPSYTSSHEGHYTTLPLSSIKADTLMDMPALFEWPENIFAAVTEAELVDYAGMYLSKRNGVLTSTLSPLPGQTKIKVKAVLPHQTPWRVILISDRVGSLIESNILTTLNKPCNFGDVSWIKPGKTTFPWWNGNVTPDTLNAPGNNFVTQQYYIDFCARNNLQYHSVVEYGLHQWYMDDGVGFQPGPHSDVTTPVPGLNMKEVCDYAKQKGVGIRVWVHFYALYPKLDSAFSIFEKWGLSGMMVDFMDRDDQLMVNMQNEILQKAAAHHLHIQFHGAYKPTGMSRTYPNEFTREGTLNYEADKWTDEGLSPDHDIYMPFTRLLAGSTDYHLGGFRAVPQNKFRAQYTRPLMLGTRCHMLAMYVVLENALGMVCDYPEAYEGQPGFEFIKEIPTTWDETEVIDAKVQEFITIARKKNNEWYVGSITNHQGRTVSVPLQFLGDGVYNAEIYTDAQDAATNPNNLKKEIKRVTKKDTINLILASGGGEVIHLSNAEPKSTTP